MNTQTYTPTNTHARTCTQANALNAGTHKNPHKHSSKETKFLTIWPMVIK